MKIVMIASEVVPFAKTGGLADVVGALPKELKALGDDVSIIMPYYGKKMDAAAYGIKPVAGPAGTVEIKVGANKVKGKILSCELDGIKIYLISQSAFFDREEIYQTSAGDYPDNSARFIFFSRAAVEAMINLKMDPDIVHAHDWQAALVPAYMKTLYRSSKVFRGTKTLFTIHNLGYQGLFRKETMGHTGLGWNLFTFDKLEHWGELCVLKGGIAFSDAISTVSKKYAKEILTQEQGMGLDAALAERNDVLFGIVNGIDYSAWNPETDKLIPANYSPGNMGGKAKCKKALRRKFKLPDNKLPVIGIVSRLASQKGFDILSDAMANLMKRDVQLVILGTGEEKYHRMLAKAAKKFSKRIGLKLAFDNAIAHLIEAGSDMFLMPSRYEPCGLNQLISLKYGTIPIVRSTGGLDDTIVEFNPKSKRGNGFKFKAYTSKALLTAIDHAIATYGKSVQWKALMDNAMKSDFSWKRSAKEYQKLYRKMLKG